MQKVRRRSAAANLMVSGTSKIKRSRHRPGPVRSRRSGTPTSHPIELPDPNVDCGTANQLAARSGLVKVTHDPSSARPLFCNGPSLNEKFQLGGVSRSSKGPSSLTVQAFVSALTPSQHYVLRHRCNPAAEQRYSRRHPRFAASHFCNHPPPNRIRSPNSKDRMRQGFFPWRSFPGA